MTIFTNKTSKIDAIIIIFNVPVFNISTSSHSLLGTNGTFFSSRLFPERRFAKGYPHPDHNPNKYKFIREK